MPRQDNGDRGVAKEFKHLKVSMNVLIAELHCEHGLSVQELMEVTAKSYKDIQNAILYFEYFIYQRNPEYLDLFQLLQETMEVEPDILDERHKTMKALKKSISENPTRDIYVVMGELTDAIKSIDECVA